jgi:DNA-binding NtrC family response regulator
VAEPKKDRFSAHPILLAKSIISLLISEARILEDAGFSVLEATSSDGAISYLESRSDIRCLIADCDVSGCFDGRRLACHVEKRWPNVRVIIVGAPSLPKSNLLQTIFVPRPYDILELIRRRKEA